jgi:regulator of protease activity HflC (stomatin/prohibitin superfamily)
MLLILVVLYWLFARHLERIDLYSEIDQYWQGMVPFFRLPGFVVLVVELLHPRVLRHLITVIVGWLLAEGAAVGLVQTLYDLHERQSARLFLGRLRSSQRAFGRAVSVKGKTLAAEREDSVLLRVGGPGKVSIYDTEVAVTEMNGRFHRVLGPGRHGLGRFEFIYAVLDLRRQERAIRDVSLMTKDGIEIRANATVSYRIDTGGEPATKARPYPYDEVAVRRAAYAESVLASGRLDSWEGFPVSVTNTNLAQIVAKYKLDQLLYPRGSAIDPHLTIKNELERLVRVTLEEYGIELSGLHLGRLELPEEVVKQYIEYWQADWERQAQLTEADGEAFTLEEVEVARAEAEITMIRAIIEGLQRARLEGSVDTMREVVPLRLIEAMEKVAKQSQETLPLPAGLMPDLSALREQLTMRGSDT